MASPSENPQLPPQNLEAEQSILGAILIDNDALDWVGDSITPDDYYRESHRQIYQAMTRLSTRNEAIDVITLSEELGKTGHLDVAGGMTYLMTLAETVPSAANVGHYAKIVREKAIIRRLLSATNEITRAVHAEGADAQSLLDEAEQRIFEVSQVRARQSMVPVKDVVTDVFHQINELFQNPDSVTGLPTHYYELDEKTGGLQRGDLIIVAGRPSMGKTALALCMGLRIATSEAPAGVAVFSLEMSKELLAKRLLAVQAKIDSSKLKDGKLGADDWTRLTNAAGKVSRAPIYIDDTPAISIVELRAKARRLASQLNGTLGLIVVDYLQLMQAGSAVERREQEISAISRSLKALAKELNVPVIALSQLNRSVESRPNKRPMMSDLRESGAIEQDADVIMFIYREEAYLRQAKEDVPEDVQGVAEIIIGKQRNGPTGVVKLRFLDKFTAFENPDTFHGGTSGHF
ncbi:MAG: replicative DNA helicase [Myxococcales bacterium]|nr:replicative DNA helicase [Myxococcales bacterium]